MNEKSQALWDALAALWYSGKKDFRLPQMDYGITSYTIDIVDDLFDMISDIPRMGGKPPEEYKITIELRGFSENRFPRPKQPEYDAESTAREERELPAPTKQLNRGGSSDTS